MIAPLPPRVVAYLYARYSPRPLSKIKQSSAFLIPEEEISRDSDGAVVTSMANACKSVERQLEYLRAECARLGWIVGGEHFDKVYSGDDADRPGLWEALEALGESRRRKNRRGEAKTPLGELNAMLRRPGKKSHKSDRPGRVLMVLDLSRLARDTTLSHIITREIWNRGGSVYSLTGEKSFTAYDSPDDEYLRNVLAAGDQRQRRITAVRTRLSHQQKQASGKRITRKDRVPFGMRAAAEGRLEPHPDEQAALTVIADMAREGKRLSEIRDQLIRCGFKPRGSRWHESTIMRVRDRLLAERPAG